MQVIGKALSFDAVSDAHRAEDLGYDGVRVIDHFFSGIPPSRTVASPHSFVTLASAAVTTSRVLLTQTMVAATLRHPFEVAQAVACIDRLSGGRAELGLGTGWLAAEHDAMGIDLGSPSRRVKRVVEAATICRQMFSQSGCVDFDGEIFRAHSEAAWPATPHRPEIVIGAHGPELLRAAARVADRVDLLEALAGDQPDFSAAHINSEDNMRQRMRIAMSAAAERGRSLTFSATVNLHVVADQSECEATRGALATVAHCEPAVLAEELLRIIDIADGVLDRLRTLASLGIDRLHIRPMDEATGRWLDGALPQIRAIT